MPPIDAANTDCGSKKQEISKTGETQNHEEIRDKIWTELKPADFKAGNSSSLGDGAQEHLCASHIEPNGSINFAPSVGCDGIAQSNTNASPFKALQADLTNMMQDISNGDLTKLEKDLPQFFKDLLIGLTGPGHNAGAGSGNDGVGPQVSSGGGDGGGGSDSGGGSGGGSGDQGGGGGDNGDQGVVGADKTTPSPLAPVGDQGGNFLVSTSGFVAPNGKEWVMSGLNASVDDALNGFPNVLQDFPKLTAIRLNVNPGQDSMANIDKVVQEYTAKGIVVELEDHSGNGSNVDWYTQMAQQYKSNSLVMLETPNEPGGDAQSVASSQIQIIQAIRSAGFNNPIGIQPVGGYDQSNIDMVTSAVGKNNLFVTPHIYYGGTDPNGAMAYAQSEIDGANQKGLYAAIDEFGSAMDGWHKDPLGDSVNQAMMALNQQGYGQEQHVGAIYWAMDNGNHPDGADSAFLDIYGNQLTPEGQALQQSWLG